MICKPFMTLTEIFYILFFQFSKQTVIECYTSFIEYFPRAEKVLDDLSTKSSFQKFIEVIASWVTQLTTLEIRSKVNKFHILIQWFKIHLTFPLLQQIERETRSKLPLKAQIVKPAQRIPRYELLIKVSSFFSSS